MSTPTSQIAAQKAAEALPDVEHEAIPGLLAVQRSAFVAGYLRAIEDSTPTKDERRQRTARAREAKSRKYDTPEKRSDLARKAALARWAKN